MAIRNLRRFPRGTLRGAAQLAGSFGRVGGEVVELSVGGAFVAGVPALPSEASARAWILLPHESRPVPVRVRVLYSRPAKPLCGAGVGIAFEDLGPEDAERITRAVERTDILHLSVLFKLQSNAPRDELEQACLDAGIPLGLSDRELHGYLEDVVRRYHGNS